MMVTGGGYVGTVGTLSHNTPRPPQDRHISCCGQVTVGTTTSGCIGL